MNPTLGAICAGAGFGLWSLVMSLSGLRSGGVAFMLLAGTLLVTAPWYLMVRPEPFMFAGRSPMIAISVGLFAACLNGLGMLFLPPLLDAPPAIVGTRMVIINLTIIGIGVLWSVGFGGQTLTAPKMMGLLLAVSAVYLLSR